MEWTGAARTMVPATHSGASRLRSVERWWLCAATAQSTGSATCWTLTHAGAGEHRIAKVRRHVERFLAKIVKARHGERFPYVWVPELHESGHGIHVHMAVGMGSGATMSSGLGVAAASSVRARRAGARPG